MVLSPSRLRYRGAQEILALFPFLYIIMKIIAKFYQKTYVNKKVIEEKPNFKYYGFFK